jgi:hypothetical protein
MPLPRHAERRWSLGIEICLHVTASCDHAKVVDSRQRRELSDAR